ncbi:hypothetical protein CRYUN_Cryun07bG0106700 [Craigia yunnanensis]
MEFELFGGLDCLSHSRVGKLSHATWADTTLSSCKRTSQTLIKPEDRRVAHMSVNPPPLMASFALSSFLVFLPTSPPIPSLCLSHLSFRYNLVSASTGRLVPNLAFSYRNTSLNRPFLSPSLISKTRNVEVRSQLRYPIISPEDHWATWIVLRESEKTKIGSMVSAALVSTLVGLAASNLGIIPFEAPAYSLFMRFLLPLAIPLLLFRADLRRVIRSTGTLLLAFLLGSVSTIVGTLVAFLMVPMRSLGPDNWKIASALMGSYIGGCKLPGNFSASYSYSYLIQLQGNHMFESAFHKYDILSSKFNSKYASQLSTFCWITVSVNYIAISEALVVSPSVLAAGVAADNVICAIYFTVLFALASKVAPEASSSTNGIFCCGGCNRSIWNVINTAPSIFLFALVQVSVHLVVILGLGKLFRFDLKLLLLASNANVGGSLVVPGILAGIFEIAIATFLSIVFGTMVLRNL